MSEKITTSGASAQEIAQAIREVLTESNEMSKTTLKIKEDSSISKAKESIEGLTEALEAYEKYINKNKTNHSKSAYFTTEEQAINRLKNAWNEYAKERNSGIVNDDNLAKSDSAKRVLALANALEALTGNSNSISKVSIEIANLVSHMREMSNFKNYNLDVSQFKEAFLLLSNIQKLYPDLSEITKSFKGIESPVDDLVSLITSSGYATSNASDGYEEYGKSAEEAAQKVEKLTEAEMERRLKSEHQKDYVDEWDLGLDENLSDVKKYSAKLDELKSNLTSTLSLIVYYNNRLADGETISKYGTDHQERLNDNIKQYHKYVDQLEYVQDKLQDAIKTVNPDAKGDNAEELNLLVLILRSLYEEITKISNAFANVDENSGIGSLVKSIDSMNESLSATIENLSKISEGFSGVNLNLVLNDNKDPVKKKEKEGWIKTESVKKLREAYSELLVVMREAGVTEDKLISSAMRLSKEVDIYEALGNFGSETKNTKVTAYKDVLDAYSAALKQMGVDISAWESKFKSGADAAYKEVEDIALGTKDAEEYTKRLLDLFGGANNVELSGMTIQLEGVVQQLREISKLIESGFTVNDILNGKPFDTTDETKGLTAVKDSVDLIAEAINKKNDLFKEEEGIVAKTVPNETNYLGKLISSLKIINNYLEKIAKFSGLDLTKINFSGIENGKIASGATNISGDPKKAKKVKERTVIKAESMTSEEIEARTKSLTEKTSSLEQTLTASGSIVTKIVEFYDSQENLVKTVLQEEKELDGVLQKTTWTTNYDKNTGNSFSSHIDTNDYETIRKRDAAEEKRIENERLAQSKRIANEEKKTKDQLTRESYNQEKRWLNEIYALKERNAQAVEKNSPTQERDIAYNDALIRSYEELISDEKEYRIENNLVNDDRNNAHELVLLAEYEAKRDAYNQSLEETIRLARQEADIENERLKREQITASYDKEINLLKEINGLRIKNVSATKEEKAANDVLITQKEKLLLQERDRRAINNLSDPEEDVRITQTKIKLSDELTTAQNAYNASQKEGTKHSKDIIVLQDKLNDELSKLSLTIGNIQTVKANANGSAVVEFIQTIGDVSRTTTITINDMVAAIKEIQTTGTFDYTKYDPKAKRSNNKTTTKSSSASNNTVRQVDEISEAYGVLIKTEKTYQKLTAKKNILGLTPGEVETLSQITAERERANKVLSTANNLTEKQLELLKKYIDINNDVSNSMPDYSESLSTKSNNKAADEYDRLYKKAKTYYTLKEKSAGGTISATEKKVLEELEKAWDDATKAQGKYAKQSGGDDDRYNATRDKFMNNASSAYIEDIEKFIKDRQKDVASIERNPRNLEYIESYNLLLEDLNNKIKLLKTQNIDVVSDDSLGKVNELRVKIEGLLAELKSQTRNKDYMAADPSDVYKQLGKLKDFLHENTAMSSKFKESLKELEGRYLVLIETGGSEAELDALNEEYTKLIYKIKDAGKLGDSLFKRIGKNIFGKTATFFASYFSAQDIYRYVSEGFETVRELDTAFTEMRKVSDETTESLRNFSDASFDLANNVGATAIQIQNSTADFMRLGESLEDAKQSAQDANILLNVSEFDNIDDATSSLVSMGQAYNELDKMDIIDKLNIVGNNYAISTDELAQALQNSASALKVAGNDIDQAIALTTAANTIVQDYSKVSAGIRTISMRITGATAEELQEAGEDVDGLIETTAKLEDTVRSLTAVNGGKGVSILDPNGNFRDTYDILLDIAKIWDEIGKQDKLDGQNRQNVLLESLAGKNRASILAAILQSPDILESAYLTSSQDYKGSALEENEKYLDSINGKITELKNNTQEFWHTLINSEFAKDVIDLLSTIVKQATEFVDKIGTIPTILGTAGAGVGLKKLLTDGGGRAKKSALYNMLPAC